MELLTKHHLGLVQELTVLTEPAELQPLMDLHPVELQGAQVQEHPLGQLEEPPDKAQEPVELTELHPLEHLEDLLEEPLLGQLEELPS